MKTKRRRLRRFRASSLPPTFHLEDAAESAARADAFEALARWFALQGERARAGQRDSQHKAVLSRRRLKRLAKSTPEGA